MTDYQKKGGNLFLCESWTTFIKIQPVKKCYHTRRRLDAAINHIRFRLITDEGAAPVYQPITFPYHFFLFVCGHRIPHAHRPDINKMNVVAHRFTPTHLFSLSYYSLIPDNFNAFGKYHGGIVLFVIDPCTHIWMIFSLLLLFERCNAVHDDEAQVIAMETEAKKHDPSYPKKGLSLLLWGIWLFYQGKT